MNEQLLKQLGIEQQILQQMVDERAALAEAERLGITVERRGSARSASSRFRRSRRTARSSASSATSSCCASQRPPLTPSEFEDSVRRSSTVEKLRASLTDWMSVSDKELEQEYRRRNDKVKLAVVSFTADSFRAEVTATDATSRRYFDAHKDDFKIREKRKIRYLLDRHRRAARQGHRAAGRHRARLQRQHRAVLDARAGARQPHPAQDRRQGRSGGEGEGRGRPEAGQGRRRLRRAGEEVFGRRSEREERRRPRLLRRAAAWCRSSSRRRSRCSPARSATW